MRIYIGTAGTEDILHYLSDFYKKLITDKVRCRNMDWRPSEHMTKELIFQEYWNREALKFLKWPNNIFEKDSIQHSFLGCVLSTFLYLDDYDLKTMKGWPGPFS